MNDGSKQAPDRRNRPGVPDGGVIAGKPGARTLMRTLPRWLLWAGGGVAVAVCIAILLMWGIYGPTYLFDLIAAYCA